MAKVFLEISLSLDGYTAGRDVSDDLVMGENGETLHDWMFTDRSRQEVDALWTDKFRDVGGIVVGRRTADLGIGPWGENPAYHAPCFVVTHRPHDTIVKQGGTSYKFVTDGIESALKQAKDAAGDQEVAVLGGADIGRQYLNAGLLDELRLHVTPVLLGGGTRLFDDIDPRIVLTQGEVSAEPLVTHVTYAVSR